MIDSQTPKKRGPTTDLTFQRRQLALDFIHEYRRIKKGVSPTYAQIAVGVGFVSASEGTACHTLIDPLIEAGWLERMGGARSIVPTRPPTDEYYPVTDPELKAIRKRQRNLAILRRL